MSELNPAKEKVRQVCLAMKKKRGVLGWTLKIGRSIALAMVFGLVADLILDTAAGAAEVSSALAVEGFEFIELVSTIAEDRELFAEVVADSERFAAIVSNPGILSEVIFMPEVVSELAAEPDVLLKLVADTEVTSFLQANPDALQAILENPDVCANPNLSLWIKLAVA